MSKANEPAYPQRGILNATNPGPTQRDKLAMEIYAGSIIRYGSTLITNNTILDFELTAKLALRAADIFFEQLEKNPEPPIK
jgi:hypothetical protein